MKSNLEDFYKAQKYHEDRPGRKLLFEDDPTLHKAQRRLRDCCAGAGFEESKVAALEAADLQVHVHEAEAGVKQAQEEVNKAQLAIDLCTVRAKSAGTIERVTIGQGTTLGIGTRDPALWLIPAGTRIVRAEVEADFAHRVGKDIEGKEVTVFDNTDPRLTYKGTVRTVGGTFLPKRSAANRCSATIRACWKRSSRSPTRPRPASRRSASGSASASGWASDFAESVRTPRAGGSRPGPTARFRSRSVCSTPAKRRAMNALYAFMRVTDDLADEPGELAAKRDGTRGVARRTNQVD